LVDGHGRREDNVRPVSAVLYLGEAIVDLIARALEDSGEAPLAPKLGGSGRCRLGRMRWCAVG
jgi:hypothetical protein